MAMRRICELRAVLSTALASAKSRKILRSDMYFYSGWKLLWQRRARRPNNDYWKR